MRCKSAPFEWPQISCACIVLFLGIASGCSDGRPERVPVAGAVTIDGQPLQGAFVNFYPATGRPSNGRTDQSGNFVLGCFEDQDGAQVGVHGVTIIAVQEINPNTMKWLAPKKYANHSTSGLQYTIDTPVSDLKIELTWDGGKPFIERASSGD